MSARKCINTIAGVALCNWHVGIMQFVKNAKHGNGGREQGTQTSHNR